MQSGQRVAGRMPPGSDQSEWNTAGDVRSAVGAAFSPDCRFISAALVSAQGHGLRMRPYVVAHHEAAVPAAITEKYGQASAPRSDCGPWYLSLAEGLANTAADVVGELVGSATEGPLAIAVEDPGLWSESPDSGLSYASILDPAWLAERTGMNVIDALPSRDIVQRGRGGPLATMGQWLLLGSHGHSEGRRPVRVLVELEETVRLTYLPPIEPTHSAMSPLVVFDVGPGLALLDRLVVALTEGQESSDTRGTLAVQGQQIPELFRSWLDDPLFSQRTWHRDGLRPDSLLARARQGTIENGWKQQDILCTATHVVAAAIVRAAEERLPKSAPVDELILTGRGRKNGFLQREIRDRIPNRKVTPIDQMGVDDQALYPASVGILALLYMDRVPAGATAVTGAAVPRLLGRLTPGSPANWHRLLREMARFEPPMMTLRAAV